MPLANSARAYGDIAKAFHWLTALLILTAFTLGLVANAMPYATEAEFAAKAQLFSLHKTLGVAVLLSALACILWALSGRRPAPLHPDRRIETFAADTVHWALYASLVLVPLSGWLVHSATTGYAPILWPFGQSLPLVPKSAGLAASFASLHWLFTKVLAVAVLLHLAGTAKHALFDRDATLRRIWFGGTALPDAGSDSPRRSRAPALAAGLIWLAAIGSGLALAPQSNTASLQAPRTSGGGWHVIEGHLAITVRQMGKEIEGRFADWAAQIAFDPDTGTGTVTVTVNIASLDLGTVTPQALAAEFLDAAGQPTAVFTAGIRRDGEGFLAEGRLALKGAEVPVSLPFSLALDGDTARMAGAVTLDRLDFGIGTGYPSDRQVGLAVVIDAGLTATRAD